MQDTTSYLVMFLLSRDVRGGGGVGVGEAYLDLDLTSALLSVDVR